MDETIKHHFDRYRSGNTLPPELVGGDFKDTRLFPDQEKLNRFRDWKRGMEYRVGEDLLIGALDELLVKDGKYIPLDYKTKGSKLWDPKKYGEKYYQLQLDSYALLLEENGCPSIGYGFLIFYSPQQVQDRGVFRFMYQCVKIKTDIERARETFRRGVAFLQDPQDAPTEELGECEYCEWVTRVRDLEIPGTCPEPEVVMPAEIQSATEFLSTSKPKTKSRNKPKTNPLQQDLLAGLSHPSKSA